MQTNLIERLIIVLKFGSITHNGEFFRFVPKDEWRLYFGLQNKSSAFCDNTIEGLVDCVFEKLIKRF